MRWGNIIFNNFWPKVISLALAAATWFYVFDLVNTDSRLQEKETIEDIFNRYKFIVKEVPVKPVFSGKSPKGRRVAFDKVKIEPSVIAIFGPEDIIEGVNELRTDKINIGEYTRSAHLRLGLNSDIKFLEIKDNVVDVYLPVEVVEKDERKEANPKQE
ncbi:MAG: YbbR-like domain-containing protein [Candidatus Omnitrophota bacterium]|nr:YbbR-like domain-containing protein [Candidatus Omnitrophota bacterium]